MRTPRTPGRPGRSAPYLRRSSVKVDDVQPTAGQPHRLQFLYSSINPSITIAVLRTVYSNEELLELPPPDESCDVVVTWSHRVSVNEQSIADFLKTPIGFRQEIIVTDTLKLLFTLSFRHEDGIEITIERFSNLLNQSDSGIPPSVLPYLSTGIENVQRTMKVLDLLTMATRFPRHVGLALTRPRCTKSVV